MRISVITAAGWLAIFAASNAQAASVVIGDSLGVGVSMASGLQRLARNSVAIRGTGAISQIKQVKRGTVAFLSLGTNDAVGRVRGLEKSIDGIVKVAEVSGVTLVWLGPPCVYKPWDARSRELDQILRARLASTSVRYVSMRDAQLCSHEVRARDGVHFTMKGYNLMWEKARSAVAIRSSAAVKPESPASDQAQSKLIQQ